jgi:hypothetical protein
MREAKSQVIDEKSFAIDKDGNSSSICTSTFPGPSEPLAVRVEE